MQHIEIELVDNRTFRVPALEQNMKCLRNFLASPSDFMSLVSLRGSDSFVQLVDKKSIKVIKVLGDSGEIGDFFDELNTRYMSSRR